MLLSARIILADGTLLDTGNDASKQAFSMKHAEFITQIQSLRDQIRTDKELSARIRYKYSIKNVTGLNLLPFITFDDPFDIITHLMVGFGRNTCIPFRSHHEHRIRLSAQGQRHALF